MEVWEIALIAVALSMDAVAVGMTDGMAEPAMSMPKRAAVAVAFGLFQGLMPLVGYYLGYTFSALVGKIAPWLSFGLLAFIGGKAIVSSEWRKRRAAQLLHCRVERGALTAGKLFAQAIATSLDALAVGVALLAEETSGGLPFHIALCALCIALTTYVLSAAAVEAGTRVGDRFAENAEPAGGAVLILVGLKILLEGVL